jgi:hypothetical protein
MTSKEECTSGAAPLAGAVRPDEKTGAGGSAPAPVPAGDAWTLASKLGRVDRFPFRMSGTMKTHNVECVVLERSDVEQLAAALSKQVPAGDAVALAAHVVKLYKAAYAAERLLLRAIAAKGEGCYSYIQARDGAMLEATATINALRDAMGVLREAMEFALSREGQADSTGGTTT